MAPSFQQIRPLSFSLFRGVTGQLIAEKLLSSFNQASHVTARLRRRRRRGDRKKKSLSAVMSKASIFTEQLGVSSQRSDVRTHYGSATTNCFKVKVADLTVLYFKWQTQILAVATQSAVLAWRHAHTQEKESWLATEISTHYMVYAKGTYFKYLHHVMFCREKSEVNVGV